MHSSRQMQNQWLTRGRARGSDRRPESALERAVADADACLPDRLRRLATIPASVNFG